MTRARVVVSHECCCYPLAGLLVFSLDLQSNSVEIILDNDVFATINDFGDVALVNCTSEVELINSKIAFKMCHGVVFFFYFVYDLLQEGRKRIH